MADIRGTAKDDHIVGTAGADRVDGRNGDDWIEGGAGNDTLTGGRGHDTFVLRAGDGLDVITDFDVETDRMMFDSRHGIYDGILGEWGQPVTQFDNSNDTAFWTTQSVDWDLDGDLDSLVTMDSGNGQIDQFVLLDVYYGNLNYYNFYGG